MLKKVSIRLLLFLAGLTLLTGCIKSPLKKNIQLNPIKTEKATYKETIDGITVQTHKLSKQEAKQLLGIAIKNTAVIKVTVNNNTPITYELKKGNTDLGLLSTDALTLTIKNRNNAIKYLGIATGSAYGIGLFSVVPCCLSLCAIRLPLPTSLIPIILNAAIIGGVSKIAISIGKSISKKRNAAAKTTHHILNRLSPEILTIAPSTTESMLLFVDSYKISNRFNLGLCPADTQNLTHNFRVTV